jgi:hypothetical protein
MNEHVSIRMRKEDMSILVGLPEAHNSTKSPLKYWSSDSV